MTSELTHLSVWLHPTPDQAAPVDRVIAELAERHATPRRPAHVTLVGGFDLAECDARARFDILAGVLEPIEVTAASIDVGDAVHKALLLRLMPEPRLAAAVDLATEIFGLPFPLQDGETYEPHISLQYSTLPRTDRRRIAASVRLPLPLTFRLTGVSLWSTDMADLNGWRQLESAQLPARPPPLNGCRSCECPG